MDKQPSIYQDHPLTTAGGTIQKRGVGIKTTDELIEEISPIIDPKNSYARIDEIVNTAFYMRDKLIESYNSGRIDICSICSYEDFGYCGRRNEKLDLKYKHDNLGNLIKCSGFCACKEFIERRFKLSEV